MLVDMAGSENIDQAGQIGLEAKMQVECISFDYELFALYFQPHSFKILFKLNDEQH